MDTEHFLLKRHNLVTRLESRRARDTSSYPFRLGGLFRIKLPLWLRLGLSVIPRAGLVSGLMQVGLPLLAPFFMKKQVSFLDRLLARFYPAKS